MSRTNSCCDSGKFTLLCLRAHSIRVSQALPSLLPIALLSVLSSQSNPSTNPKASSLSSASNCSLALKASFTASEVRTSASKILPEQVRIVFTPYRQRSLISDLLTASYFTVQTDSKKLLKIQQQMKAVEASTRAKPEQQSHDSLGESPSPIPAISFWAAATPRKNEFPINTFLIVSGLKKSSTLLISTAVVVSFEASFKCSRISTTGFPLLMLSSPLVMNLATWRWRMVFSPSQVTVGDSSVWMLGMPEQLENPWPPAALLMISRALRTSAVNTALSPLDKTWAGLSLEKSPLSCTSCSTSKLIALNFLLPNMRAQVSAINGSTLSCCSWQFKILISSPASFLNCLLTSEYLVMIVTADDIPQKQDLGIPDRIINMVAQDTFSLPLFSYFPSRCTLEQRLSILSLGIRTLLSLRNPLSLALYPILGPMSPTSMPGRGLWVSMSLMLTTKAWGPYRFSPTISCAMTHAWLAKTPRSPIHHLVALTVGVFSTKVSVLTSQVAVVSRFCTSEPWPSSVCAQQPNILPSYAGSRKSFFCFSVQRFLRIEQNMAKCTLSGIASLKNSPSYDFISGLISKN